MVEEEEEHTPNNGGMVFRANNTHHGSMDLTKLDLARWVAKKIHKAVKVPLYSALLHQDYIEMTAAETIATVPPCCSIPSTLTD